MPWTMLGSITPASVWQSLPGVTNSTLFKISQSWNNQFPGVGSIKFALDFDGLIFEGGASLVELNAEVTQIVRLVIPRAFDSDEFANRRLAVKLSEDTRVYAQLPGKVKIEQWDGTDDSGTTIDGGIY